MFTEQEIENLSMLLVSADNSNVELGLELLFNNPEYLEALQVPAFLFMEFGKFDDDLKELALKRKLKQLWQQTFHEKVTQLFKKETKILHLNYKIEIDFFEYLENYEKVSVKYEAAILANPGYAISLYKPIATTLRRNYKRYEKAYFYYHKVIEAIPYNINLKLEFVDFLLNDCFANGHLVDVELDRVESFLREAMLVYPQYQANYLHILATCSDIYRKDKTKAKELYYAVLKIKPDAASTLNNLANVLFKTDGVKDEARRLSTLAVKLDSKNYHYLDTLAWIEFKGFNNLEGAEELFRSIRKIDKNEEHDASLTGLGEVLEAKGQFEEAMKYYEKGLKLKPNSDYKQMKINELRLKIKDKS